MAEQHFQPIQQSQAVGEEAAEDVEHEIAQIVQQPLLNNTTQPLTVSQPFVPAASELSLPVVRQEQDPPQGVPIVEARQEAVIRPTKKQRRRYDNNYKAGVLEHLKNSGLKLPAIAKEYGIAENTLREWTKVSTVQAIENARLKRGGSLKANMYDPMYRLTDSLMTFFSANEKQPPGSRVPTTTKLIVSKALEARKKLLELDSIQPFLTTKEKKALEAFTGSDSWAKKFAKRHNLKMSGTRIRELGEGEIKNFSSKIHDMGQRLKVAGPPFDEIAHLLFRAEEKLEEARNRGHTASLWKKNYAEREM